jgi:hypothetical protein
MSASTFVHTNLPDGQLAVALECSLSAPLRAVEVALEHIARDLGGETETRLAAPRTALAMALRQAEAAVGLLTSRPLRADTCSLREVVCGARAALPAGQRERVWVASEPCEQALVVDSTLLVEALTALIGRATEEPEAEVLVHAHQEDGQTTFAVVDDLEAHGDVLAHGEATPDSPALLLARAHLMRLGAELGEYTAGPHRCVTVRLKQGGCP